MLRQAAKRSEAKSLFIFGEVEEFSAVCTTGAASETVEAFLMLLPHGMARQAKLCRRKRGGKIVHDATTFTSNICVSTLSCCVCTVEPHPLE